MIQVTKPALRVSFFLCLGGAILVGIAEPVYDAAHAPHTAAPITTVSSPHTECRKSCPTAVTSATVDAALKFCTENPERASECGDALIDALVSAGRFDEALRFANAAAIDQREGWLSDVYSLWSSVQPRAAIQSALHIDNPARRENTLKLIANIWSRADACGVIEFSQQLPFPPLRVILLREALPCWVSRDPVAAAQWMAALGPAQERDTGAAAIARLPTLVQRQPEISILWAESIANEELRRTTLIDVISTWNNSDSVAARNYASKSAQLSTHERENLQSMLASSAAR